ncbi:MAG: alpha/beta hydrolase [Candidatus Limnocylindria bacterium]
MPYEPPPQPLTRRSRVAQRVTFLFAALLLALVAYFGYLGFEGSRQFTEAPTPSTDCRTPATMGWDYEAVNYDQSSDLALADEPDPTNCTARSAPAGDEVIGPGEVGLAAWYIPAGSGAGPSAPTVVLVHGWGSSKHDMLDRAAVLHDAYHLLIPDLRNHGQSGDAQTTQGLQEAADLRAMIDWLVTAKAPTAIAVLGVSMGGAAALAEANQDERIAGVIVESTHATLANAIQARLERAGYPLSLPGSWAILLGSLMRTGLDASSVDPVLGVQRMDGRPIQLVYGAADDTIGPHDATDLEEAAHEAGSAVDLAVCEGAAHAETLQVCPEAWSGAVLGFLERVIGPGG